MPIEIEKIKNFNIKSWKENSNIKEIKFNQKNIIFGYNGAGKSSLAREIIETYDKTAPTKSYRFFSSKYLDDILRLDQKKGIAGVVSNFGEKDINIEKKLLIMTTKS